MSKITRRSVRALAASLALVGAVSLSACGSDSDTTDTTSAATAGVTVSKQWARTSPMEASTGAAYMDIVSAVDDKLVGAMVDASVAKMTEVHETVMVESGDMSSDTTMAMSGEMKMQKVDFVEIKAGETVSLKPGGYHIMMMELAAPLKVGTTIQVTLKFEKAGDVVVDVPVQDEAP